MLDTKSNNFIQHKPMKEFSYKILKIIQMNKKMQDKSNLICPTF